MPAATSGRVWAALPIFGYCRQILSYLLEHASDSEAIAFIVEPTPI